MSKYMKNRRAVVEKIQQISLHDIDGDLSTLQSRLDSYINSDGYDSVKLEAESERDPYGDGYEYYFVAYGSRYESEKEYDSRIAKAKKAAETRKANRAKQAAKREAAELEELARLQAKYPK